MPIFFTTMCLVILAHRLVRASPVVLAANRDEQRDRPTETVQILSEGPPRLAGGRDLRAGGTWMAVGEHNMVVALTNQRPAAIAHSERRSRGELPLLLAEAENACSAAELARALTPGSYNPCAIFIADPESAFYVELRERVIVNPLAPGLHVLENRPLGEPSPKVDRVRSQLGDLRPLEGAGLRDRLVAVLEDRTIPPQPWPDERPPELEAARVELASYGTRSATLVQLAADRTPEIWHCDQPPGDEPLTRRHPFG